MKHTKGPWIACELGEEDGTWAKWSIVTNGPICYGGYNGYGPDNSSSNARLIAAAPELLEALERAVPWIGKLIAEGCHLNSVCPNDAIGALEQAQAVISKAKGVES